MDTTVELARPKSKDRWASAITDRALNAYAAGLEAITTDRDAAHVTSLALESLSFARVTRHELEVRRPKRDGFERLRETR